jgi:ABC-type uncharacterized transport system permease subunit
MGPGFAANLARAAGVAAPFVLAILIGAIVLAATGHAPLGVYELMASEAFGGERRIASTLTAATPLLLTGLAAAVAFRSGIFNVGVEGCFYLGGMIAAVLGFAFGDWPAVLLIPFALAGAAHRRRGLWRVDPRACCGRSLERRRSRHDLDAELHRGRS